MANPPWRPSQKRPAVELEEPEDLRPSRSSRQRFGDENRDLATELFKISDHDLKSIPLEENLKEALVLGRSITKHGGRRRQLQYVAKLLRTLDTTPIEEAIERSRHNQQTATLRTHTVEEWRTRLIADGDPAVAALAEQCDRIEPTVILKLVAEARREERDGLPKRAFRELFKVLWDLLVA